MVQKTCADIKKSIIANLEYRKDHAYREYLDAIKNVSKRKLTVAERMKAQKFAGEQKAYASVIDLVHKLHCY